MAAEVFERVTTAAPAESFERVAPVKPADASGSGIMLGALADTFSRSGRPGAVPLTGAPGNKTPLGAILKPGEHGGDWSEKALEHLASGATKGAAFSAIPGGWAARIGLGAGLGAATPLAEGKGPGDAAWGALIDAAATGVAEGVAGTAGRVARSGVPMLGYTGGAAQRGYEWATKAPGQALDALRQRLGNARIVVPSLGPGKVTLDEAVHSLSKLTGDAYRTARAELAHIMNRIDRQHLSGGPKPYAGTVFRDRTADDRFAAPGLARLSEWFNRLLSSRATRGALDTAATTDVAEGLPAGVVAGAGMAKLPASLLRPFVPGADILRGR